MNVFEFVLGIIVVGGVVSVLKARYGIRQTKNGDVPIHDGASAENARLMDEIRALRDRIHVLERVVTDSESGARIDREIDKLRDDNRV